jgi:hypothetical protein
MDSMGRSFNGAGDSRQVDVDRTSEAVQVAVDRHGATGKFSSTHGAGGGQMHALALMHLHAQRAQMRS